MERLTSGSVGNVFYKDITPEELSQKQEAHRLHEKRNAEMRVLYPYYDGGRDHVGNLHCAGCGNWFSLNPALCHPCLERSLRSDGPYRTMPPLTLEQAEPETWTADRQQLYRLNYELERVQDALDMERWHSSRLKIIAGVFGVLALCFGIALKVLHG